MSFFYRFVDLTHTLHAAIPTWPGSCGFNHDLHIDYQDCQGDVRFRVMKLGMHAGIGTHMDAPSHCKQGGKTIDQFEINELCMPCFVIDVSGHMHEHYRLSVADILKFESVHGLISKGSCVLVRTGWDQFWNNPEKYRNNHVFPSISSEAVTVLFDRGVMALGIDTLSADNPQDGFNAHKLFLGNERILLENVASLDLMVSAGGYVLIAPLKIKEGTEAPVRLIGLIEK